MASKSLGTLTLDLVAKTGGFTGPMDKAARQTKKNSDQMAKAGKAVGVAIGAGAVAAVAGISLMIARERDLIDEQAKVAQKLDTTYESMANLRRAGELGGVGFNTIETAGRTLNANIGKAIQGVTLQADAFERLGLSAQEVYDVPLDQRIAMINKALDENVSASERAAVAGDLFGTRNAAAIQQLDPGTIAEAARQVEIFGLNLSDVDAAKVEMANDAMSTFGLLTDGIGKQLTVQLAPILKAVGDEFLNSADEAGGLGNQVEDAVEMAVSALAFMVDAGDGVGRVFSVVADTIVGTFATGEYWVKRISASIIETVESIPGVDLDIDTESLRKSAAQAQQIAFEAAKEISNAINEPLAGERLRKAYKAAQEAGEAAAEAAVKLRKDNEDTGDSFLDLADSANAATDAIASQLEQLDLQVATMKMSDDAATLFKLALDGATDSQIAHAKAALETIEVYEKQVEAQKEAAKQIEEINKQAQQIQDSYKDEEQRLLESYERRRQIVLDNTEVTGQARAELLRKMEEGLNEELAEINAGYWEQYLEGARENLESFDELAGETIDNFSSRFGDAFESMIFDAETLGEAVSGMAENMARSIVSALGEMAAQWLAYQAVQLLVGKSTQASGATTMAANAEAMSIMAGINAFSSTAAIPIVGPPAAPAAAAAATAVTAPMAAAVSAIALSGMAHDGIDSVPNDGTWLLQKGERVTTAETSAKLDGVLEDIRGSRAGAVGMGGNSFSFSFPAVKDAREARKSEAGMQRAVVQAMARAQRFS
ncbi:MAG: hypothetical protein CMK78_13380 [Pseudomonadales bacterium]|nr:hypothetical protein [Pseudomonadales bacterium]